MSKRRQQQYGLRDAPRRSQRVKQQQRQNGDKSSSSSSDEALARKLQNSDLSINGGSATTRSQAKGKRGQTALQRTISESDSEFPVLRRLDLYASDIKGDGNCLFRAMGDQIYGDGGKSHVQIRAEVVGYMKEHIDYFGSFIGDENGESWTEYLRRMARDGVYGDNLEIVAFAHRFNANVVIYQRESMYVVSSKEGNEQHSTRESMLVPPKQVHIAYHEWEHYSSVRNKTGPHDGIPMVKARQSPLDAQESDSQVAPDWKVKTVQNAADRPISVEYAREVLVKNNGHIGNSVDEIIMRGLEENQNGDGNETKTGTSSLSAASSNNTTNGSTDSTELTTPPTSLSSLSRSSAMSTGTNSTSESSSHSSSAQKQPVVVERGKKRKLSVQEKKAKQKQEARERRIEKRSQSKQSTAGSLQGTSTAINNVGPSQGIRAMYI